MASGHHSGDAVRQINRLFRDGTNAALTDGQLIERFTTRRPEVAEAAFETLVSRHGPMVLRVARGVLRDPHDVEDAFQATFLVLVKKAQAIGERELLGPWLYGVAHRVALKARGVAARRTRREGGATIDPPADLAEGPWLDLRPMLHEELNRLPEKYRKPVVLCHLQGLTHSEAAQELAWPVGTVSVRLSRARKLLKERLTRRGLTVTASLWAAGLIAEGASAAVPESLIRSTTMAARAFAAGKSIAAGTASAGAIALTQRTLTTMLISRLTWIAAPLVLGVGTVGAVTLAQGTADRPAEPPTATSSVVKPAIVNDPFYSYYSYYLPRRQAQANPDPNPAEKSLPEPAGQRKARRPADRAAKGPFVVDEAGGKFTLDPLPPGYFALPVGDGQGGTGPPPVKVGQTLVVEVLRALPGRPITGERLVRPDGTISLGFYGDLKVAGLNRHQIKVKMIERLRKYLGDDVLGLAVATKDGKVVPVPPVESDHVYVADDVDLPRIYTPTNAVEAGVQEGQVIVVEVLESLPGRPITGQHRVGSDGALSLGFYGDVKVVGLKRDQVKVKVIEHLRKYITDESLGLIVEDDRGERRAVAPAESDRVYVDDAVPPPQPRTSEAVQELRGQVNVLNAKLDSVLKELEELRKEQRPAGTRP